MNQTRAKHFLVFFLIAAGCSAAEGTAKADGIPVQLPVRPTAPAKPSPAPIPSGVVVVSDSSYEPKPADPVAPADKDSKPKDPAAEAKAAADAEKTRAEEEASAFAKGEGERYAKRQQAYEAARSLTPRPPVEPAKRSSIAELQMADGRYVVMAGNDRRVFASKAEAAPYLAELKQDDRPIVIEAPTKK